MKKLALLLFAVLIGTASCTQKQEHAKFQGVSINGHIDDFVAKLEQLGYEEQARSEETNGVLMTGKFTDKDVHLFIYHTPESKTVWSVWTCFERVANWDDLKASYFECKAEYVKNTEWKEITYQEDFLEPYEEGDGNEMQAVREKKSNYWTHLNGSNGGISIAISTNCAITLIHTDYANFALNNAEKKSITDGI